MIVSATPRMTMDVRLAEDAQQVSECEALIQETYLRRYGVTVGAPVVDPNGLSERMPDRLVMGRVDGCLVACAGLYLGQTYVERFGNVSADALHEVMSSAGLHEATLRPRVEFTKIVVRAGWERRGIGRMFIGASHSRHFLDVDGCAPLVLVCAKLSIFRLWRAVGIRTRVLGEFPTYRNHDRYRTSDDTMESRAIIPELDIHPRWYDAALPSSFVLDAFGGIHVQ